MASNCILVCVLVVGRSRIYDLGWWSACCPQEIPDAIEKAVCTFNFYLLNENNPKVSATRTEVTHKLLNAYEKIANDTNLSMGYPEFGVRVKVALETVKDTTAYMVLMK